MTYLAHGVVAASLLGSAIGLVAQDPTVPRVQCIVDDPDRREFLFDRADGQWRLSMKSGSTGNRWIRLALPNAAPELSAREVRLAYTNANGGRQVDLMVTPGQSSLDVWVDYGLEVNIEPDLDPRVDLMNTEGPRSNITCEVQHAPRD